MILKYYGVLGSNGIGVYTNWRLVEESKPYIKNFMNKKFFIADDALKFACWGGQYSRGIRLPLDSLTLDKLELNHFYYIDELKTLLNADCSKGAFTPFYIVH
ncbi:hypothetical protein [Anaerosinus gibii]|uniref:Uncharacterized protein n=1 Tax=Selenobaculum gibii TaxID=3054208 RepID=A0A9Y2ETE6_9FIRM|nr:hypothetical protein [Selenobaculum gbiensis]WIW69890.1 hypothetical protein P3F81_08150 [Selenobaculum gbiensis]